MVRPCSSISGPPTSTRIDCAACSRSSAAPTTVSGPPNCSKTCTCSPRDGPSSSSPTSKTAWNSTTTPPPAPPAKKNWRSEFARNFYFGCEADDPLTALAFDARLGPRLKPVLGSDISHWDVADMTTILEEAYELVDDGLLSPEEFREFTFTNAVEMHCGMNPDFFKGTIVETAVQQQLQQTHPTTLTSTSNQA